MKKFIQELLFFLKNPEDVRSQDLSIYKNITYIGYIFIIKIFFAIIIFSLMHFFVPNHVDTDYNDKINYNQNTLLYTFLLTCLVVPLVEELLFRFPLRYNKFYQPFFTKNTWSYIFKFLVYFLPLTFGIIHLSNYDNLSSVALIISSPILVGSQFLAGILYTFIRVRFNFMSAYILHMLWNTFLTLILIPIDFFTPPYHIEEKGYIVKIKSYEYSNIDNQSLSIDTLNNKIFFLSSKEYSINHLMDSVFSYKRDKADFIIDIYFKSDKGINKQEFIEIINNYE